MKRLLYLLAAVASQLGPVPDVAEAYGGAAEEEAPGVVETASDSRRRQAGDGQPGRVVVRPLGPDDPDLDPSGFAASLRVDQSEEGVSVIRTAGNPSASDEILEASLLNAAVTDAAGRGDIKVVIHAPWALDRIASLCAHHGFTHWRSLTRTGHTQHEFLADLYTRRDVPGFRSPGNPHTGPGRSVICPPETQQCR